MVTKIEVKGLEALIMHSGVNGLATKSEWSAEIAAIAAKKGKNKTEADIARLAELECQRSLWLDKDGRPSIPPGAFRASIEAAARKNKQGPQVREGMIVTRVHPLVFDEERYGTILEEWGRTTQFSVPVVVQRARLMRTRAMFEDWSISFEVERDEDLIDLQQLASWIQVAGRRIGVGDWRPQKSGHYGRFELVSIDDLAS